MIVTVPRGERRLKLGVLLGLIEVRFDDSKIAIKLKESEAD